jgi:hypothetical protein
VKRRFTASITREGDWFVAQCLEIDVASQEGGPKTKHLPTLVRPSHFTSLCPLPQPSPDLRPVEIEIGGA